MYVLRCVFYSDLIFRTVTHCDRLLSQKKTVFLYSVFVHPDILAYSFTDPGQYPSPSFAGHHVIHSVQLFRKCWISTMAFTPALLAFVWSNLGWMWWLGVQGGLTAEWESSCLSLSSGLWAAQLKGLMGFTALPTRSLQGPLKMRREGWRGTREGGECLSENCCWETEVLRQRSEGRRGKAGRTVCSSVPYTWSTFTGITD